jgi:hypothetical protein
VFLDPTTIGRPTKVCGQPALNPGSWDGAGIAFAAVAIFAAPAEFDRSPAEGVLRLPNREASDQGALLMDACVTSSADLPVPWLTGGVIR